MFLDKKYILANELVREMDIHIANVSMLRNQFEDNDDFYTVRKMANCSFVNGESQQLPKNIRAGIAKHTFTDLSNKLPCNYVREEYGITERELFKSGMVLNKEKVAGKDFYVFNDYFVKTMKKKIGYILDAKEEAQCSRKKQIIGSIRLGKNKFFTWY